MGLNPANSIDKYINTSYDDIKLIADNIVPVVNAGLIAVTHQVASSDPTVRADGSDLQAGDTYFNTQTSIKYTYSIGLTWVTGDGAFTSPGINDTATGERLQIADTGMMIGTAGAEYILTHAASDRNLVISGGNGKSSGANIFLFGETHTTLANDIYFRGSTQTVMQWDDSAGEWEFRTGLVPTPALTLDVDQNAVFVGKVDTSASTTARAGFQIKEGVAPTSPADGDIWITAAGAFNVHLNSTTVDLAAGGGGGQWVLLETITPDNTAFSYDITWDETAYGEIRIELDNLNPNVDRALLCQVGHTNGTAFHTTAADYAGTYRMLSDLVRSVMATTDSHSVTVLSVDTSLSGGLSGRINIVGGQSAGSTCIIDSLVTFIYGGGGGTPYSYEAQSHIVGTGTSNAIAIDSVKLLWNGAVNMEFAAQGAIRVYGLKNT